MTDRATLVRRIQAARSGEEMATAVGMLDAWDRGIIARAAQDRELEYAGQLVDATRMIGPMHGDRHTAATDWLGEIGDPRLDYRTAMAAEASLWVGHLPREVLADRDEFTAQALGRARTLASAYGPDARNARDTFLSHVAQASAVLQRGRALGASGLPQIDQMIDPNNNPSPTPYPTEVFPTFEDEQNQYNGGVESPDHDSEISSRSAPMLEQIQQMDGRGSGFGSGPERADEHTTSFDTADGYAEVPLGPEGTIPTGGPGAAPSAPSRPAPVTTSGAPLDEADDEERRGAHITGSRYTLPDRLGYRWLVSSAPEAFHPYHEKCASSHWPDEGCTAGMPHVASVAIDHSMTLEAAARIGRCEAYGIAEGRRALRAAHGSLRELAAAHNRLAAGWGTSARSADDTAVLRGFQAVVRPVLAESAAADQAKQDEEDAHETSIKIKIPGKAAMKVTLAELQAYGRDFSKSKRKQLEGEGDTLPGTTKLPIQNQTDLRNAERLKGKVKGSSPGKIDAYLDKEKKKLGGGKGKKNKKKGARVQANGYPMGDMRPAETMPDGSVIGDGDHDFWDHGEFHGGADYGGHPGGEGGGSSPMTANGSRPNFRRA
jgi:hypothetical protein